jgi:DNA mismatch endonuclease (patch repair protein)
LTDIVPPERRRQMMAGIHSENTAPEVAVRQWLYRNGFRYRLHVCTLPGTPDIVISRRRVIVLVHGCFWHRHSGCRLAYTPKSNCDFWLSKFAANVKRDRSEVRLLQSTGWRVVLVWECEVRDGSFGDRLRKELCQNE